MNGGINEAWLAESHDRLQAYHDGKLKALDGEEALRTIEATLLLGSSGSCRLR